MNGLQSLRGRGRHTVSHIAFISLVYSVAHEESCKFLHFFIVMARPVTQSSYPDFLILKQFSTAWFLSGLLVQAPVLFMDSMLFLV